MNSFQKTVFIIAIILLIVLLCIMGYNLYFKSYQMAFPPVVADCPDYWLDKSDGDSSKCVNVKNLGKVGNRWCPGSDDFMDFSSEMWLGPAGLDRKQAWAKYCDLQWDGVTNTNLPRSNSSTDDVNKDNWSKCSVDSTTEQEQEQAMDDPNFMDTNNFLGVSFMNSGNSSDFIIVGDDGNESVMVGGQALFKSAPATANVPNS